MSGSTTRERSRPLLNFDLPMLKWGNQRVMSCLKVDDQNSAMVPRKRKMDLLNSDEGIEAVRQKVMLDLEAAAKKMKDEIFGKKSVMVLDRGSAVVVREEITPWDSKAMPAAESEDIGSLAAAAEEEEVRPWNLRARKQGLSKGGSCGVVLKGGGRELRMELLKEEIESDYVRLFGHRPPRRPRKRPRSVQRGLDVLFPGLRLTEITTDKYRIREGNGKG